jgi:Ricin-type beta-trefoil lectin domain/Bacterial tandem repeat domain 1
MAHIIKGLGEKCLAIWGTNPDNETLICLWSINSWASAQWELTQDGYITSPIDPNKCLQLADSNTANGARIVYRDQTDMPHQKWSFDPLINCFTSVLDANKCLSVKGDINQDGTPIVLWDKNGSLGQRWSFIPVQNKFPTKFAYFAPNTLQTYCNYHILEGKSLKTFCCHYPNGNINAAPVVSGEFQSGLPLQWRAHTNLDAANFQTKIDLYASQGYGLSQLSILPETRMTQSDRFMLTKQTFNVLYTGIWQKLNAGETVRAFLKIPDADFNNYLLKYERVFRLDEHIRYSLNGQIFHAVLFNNQIKNGFIHWHSQTIDAIYKKNEESKLKGFQMVSFHSYQENNQLLFGGIWQPTGKDALFLLDMNLQQFQNRCNEFEPLGYTLQKIQVYSRGNLEKFGAIWAKTETVAFNTQMPMIKRVSLLDLAPQARWEGGELVDSDNVKDAAALPWQGSDGDSRGFVRLDHVSMEDNVVYRALRMHPKWVNKGTIKGWLPRTPLPRQACFTAKVGFVNGARGSDGVIFQVWAHYDAVWNKVAETYKPYNGSLQTIWADLSHLEGKSVGIELRVDTGPSSGQDWAAWIEPCLQGFEYSSNLRYVNWATVLNPAVFTPISVKL